MTDAFGADAWGRERELAAVDGIMRESPTRTGWVVERPAWHAQALCRGLTGEFVPEHGQLSARAARLCASCKVSKECLAVALADPDLVGVWAGTSPADRARMRAGAVGPVPSSS